MIRRIKFFNFVLLCLFFVSLSTFAGPRDVAVNQDRVSLESNGLWIYNDLEKGYSEARKNGKPLMVVYRCIP